MALNIQEGRICANKVCHRAGQVLPIVEFTSSGDGLYPRCKQCVRLDHKRMRDNRKACGLCIRFGCNNYAADNHRSCEYHLVQNRVYRLGAIDEIRAKDRQRHLQLKIDAFMAYGGIICSCPGCNETAIEFLTIDHVDGGGGEHRRLIANGGKSKGSGYKTYAWLRRNKYPPGYRVLCFNCNSARGAYGYCPHERRPYLIASNMEG